MSRLKRYQPYRHYFSALTIRTYSPTLPRQTNGTDCEIFPLLYHQTLSNWYGQIAEQVHTTTFRSYYDRWATSPRRLHMRTDEEFTYICTHGGQGPGKALTRSSHPGYINGTYKCDESVEGSDRNLRMNRPNWTMENLSTLTHNQKQKDRSRKQRRKQRQAHHIWRRHPHGPATSQRNNSFH